jgi:hypothetical protein
MKRHFKLERNVFISVNVTIFQRIVPVLAPLQFFSETFAYAQFPRTIRMQRIKLELWVFDFPKLVPPICLHLHLSFISAQILWLSFRTFSYVLHPFCYMTLFITPSAPIFSKKNSGNHKELPFEKKFTMWSCASNYLINGIWTSDWLIDSCVNCTMPLLLQVLIPKKNKVSDWIKS